MSLIGQPGNEKRRCISITLEGALLKLRFERGFSAGADTSQTLIVLSARPSNRNANR
jgi:hypothetical protein